MIFHRSRIKSNSIGSILIDNTKLTKVDYAKYLGVIIDHKLNWIEQIAYVKNKISKGIGIMYKARQYLSKCTWLNLYYAYTGCAKKKKDIFNTYIKSQIINICF